MATISLHSNVRRPTRRRGEIFARLGVCAPIRACTDTGKFDECDDGVRKMRRNFRSRDIGTPDELIWK